MILKNKGPTELLFNLVIILETKLPEIEKALSQAMFRAKG